jgi:hypothetical protein
VLLISLLVGALVIERLSHFRKIETKLDQLAKQKVSANIVTGGEEIFRGGIRTLHENRWKTVRVFAPVGLWDRLDEKGEWLQELADALDKGDKTGLEHVESFYGIFGFPPETMQPTSDDGNGRQGKQGVNGAEGYEKELFEEATKIRSKLSYVKNNLRKFEGKRNAHIHYIPPVEVSVGLGAILFENEELGIQRAYIAFSCREDHWIVDTSLGLDNFDQAFSHLIDWFDHSLFRQATDRFRLQDMGHKMSVQWQEVMEYYTEAIRIQWEEVEKEERAVKRVK